jgi:hypothetical protein
MLMRDGGKNLGVRQLPTPQGLENLRLALEKPRRLLHAFHVAGRARGKKIKAAALDLEHERGGFGIG